MGFKEANRRKRQRTVDSTQLPGRLPAYVTWQHRNCLNIITSNRHKGQQQQQHFVARSKRVLKLMPTAGSDDHHDYDDDADVDVDDALLYQ